MTTINEIEESSAIVDLYRIYYILFRHKWKILVCLLLGTMAATAVYFKNPPLYRSDLKLLIRYVLENRAMADPSAERQAQIRPVDNRVEGIIASETEILQSWDLLQDVAENITPEKILPAKTTEKTKAAAASYLRKNLRVDILKGSSVITVSLSHHDASLVVQILDKLRELYFQKHLKIHRSSGIFDDFLTKQTDTLRSKLTQTEEELRRIRTNSGIISIEDSRKGYNDYVFRTRAELQISQTLLAEKMAALRVLEKSRARSSKVDTNTPAASAVTEVPSEKQSAYRDLLVKMDPIQKRVTDLRMQFTDANPQVQANQKRLEELDIEKKAMEKEFPQLLAIRPAPSGATIASFPNGIDPVNELNMGIAGLEARVEILKDQLEKVRVDVGRVDDAETSLLQLQRQKEIEDKQYRYYVSRLEESRVEEGLGPGRVSNIGDIQRPSPPFTDALPLYKLMLGCVFGGLGLGVLLAFLSDFVFDQSIRHVHEIEKSLHTPVFVTIPELKLRNSKFIESSHGTEDSKEAEKTLANTNGEVPLALEKGLNGEAENPTYDVPGLDIRNGELLEFHDALRDRLIRHFEVEGLTRKPKLVAITSCLDKSGVTTTAAGLAASLSETGDGNVLLVDMTGERGDVHPFSRGKPVLRLPEALEKDRRSEALVQYNLYVASAEDHSGDPNFMRLLPRRFSHLVPQLKASDYDYVIFDMPPVSQTSVTAKISGAMDINLLVVEAEKTSRGATNAALDLLKASSAKTAVVINRKRGYVPKWLHAGDTI